MTRLLILVTLLLVTMGTLAGPTWAVARCQEHEIRFEPVTTAPLGRNHSNEELIDAVASLIRDKLALPLVTPIKVYLCQNGTTLDEALYRSSGNVVGVGAFTMGVATWAGAFFRSDYLTRASFEDRVKLVAHELAHVSQWQLAPRRASRVPTWIREGHAVWVEFRVLDLLALRPYRDSRAELARWVRAEVTPIERFPDLDVLARSAPWTTPWPRYATTYGQAFLAVDRLIERSSSTTLVELLRLPVAVVDYKDHWERFSPIRYREFADDFRAYMESVMKRPTGPAVDAASRP